MDRTERFYKIDKMLAERKRVTFSELLESLSVSAATLKRDLEYMRNRLNAPIIWDRDDRAYRFEAKNKHVGDQYELPGLWFNASEIHALLTMQHLLTGIDSAACLDPMYSPSCRVSMR
jgi:predicted DNA-binding transcriptional regulator YafY